MIAPKPKRQFPKSPQLGRNLFYRDPHHPAYRPGRKPMTVAVGFSCEDGVLLASDTKITTNIKTNESKLIHYTSKDRHCSLGFAVSSEDMNFPRAAALACWEYLREIDFTSPAMTMEAVRNAAAFSLAEFHKEHIQDHPDRAPGALFMRMLVGIRLHRQTALFESHETVLSPIDDCECIGSGATIGNYLTRQYLAANGAPETLANAALLAACVVEAAIEIDEYCGGNLEMLLIRNDGSIDSRSESVDYPGYGLLKRLQVEDWRLLHKLAAGDILNSQIDAALEEHSERVKDANSDQMERLYKLRNARPFNPDHGW